MNYTVFNVSGRKLIDLTFYWRTGERKGRKK